jgi:hypothetical protein
MKVQSLLVADGGFLEVLDVSASEYLFYTIFCIFFTFIADPSKFEDWN